MILTPSLPIQLLLVDDHTLFRDSLGRLLASEPEFHIAGTCASSAEALDALSRLPIDLILLDFDLGDHQGNALVAAARRAHYTGRVLMVTAGLDSAEAAIAVSLGVSGIFFKHNSPASLMEAIRRVASGDTWADQGSIQAIAANSLPRPRSAHPRSLTQREQFVLHRLFEGLNNKEIAALLAVSENAIKATLQQLFQKTGVRTRGQLVRFALESSLAVQLKL
ncbi:MAG: two-component system response regulator NarL [Acidobacteriaceae bacterium]